MAAGFLTTRIVLVFLLSELHYSSAFPSARSYAYPEARQGVRKKQERYSYGNRRPLHYIKTLRQRHRMLQSNFHDQVPVGTWQKPQESSLKVRSHAQIQNKPNLYPQTQSQYQPWSDVVTKWTEEMPASQHPPQGNHQLPQTRSFEFSLKVPFADFLDQNKDLNSKGFGSGGSDGAGHYSQSYRPSSVQIQSVFNSASGSGGFSDKGSTDSEVSKPSFQLSLSIPIPPTTTSPKPSSSNDGYLSSLKRPGSVGFGQNSYMELAKPQPSSMQSGAERTVLDSSSDVQQQTEHQTSDPIQYTDSAPITFSPGHYSQHTIPTKQINQGKIPTGQSLVFSKPSALSLSIPQSPPVQSDNIHSGYYNAQINPLSNDYGEGQSGQTASYDPTSVHLSLSPSQYERVPSEHYSTGHVKPIGQHQIRQPIAPVTFASEKYNYDQFKPFFGQNVQTIHHLSPAHPLSPTVAPSQYEHPSFHQVATTQYYGTGNVVQMEPTDFSSSSYQYSRDQSKRDSLPDRLTVFDPSPRFQGLSTDYQTQMRFPGQYTGRGTLDGKPKYTKLFIDVEDVMDENNGQHNYFAAPPPHYNG